MDKPSLLTTADPIHNNQLTTEELINSYKNSINEFITLYSTTRQSIAAKETLRNVVIATFLLFPLWFVLLFIYQHFTICRPITLIKSIGKYLIIFSYFLLYFIIFNNYFCLIFIYLYLDNHVIERLNRKAFLVTLLINVGLYLFGLLLFYFVNRLNLMIFFPINFFPDLYIVVTVDGKFVSIATQKNNII